MGGPVVGVVMVRDEADIIAPTIKHMQTQVDAIIVADNGSVDGTRRILDAMASDSLLVVDDPVVGYYQSAKWVIPFDADEIWLHVGGWPLRDVLPGLKHDVIHVPLFDHVATGPLTECDPIARMGWRRPKAAPLPKVCYRYDPELTIGMGNHDVRVGEVRKLRGR